MRMQSPASSGLLPASYSRRRRNRPNEPLADGSSNVGGSVGTTTMSSYYHHQDNDRPTTNSSSTTYYGDGTSDNISLTHRRNVAHRKPNDSDDDSENDENDRPQRSQNARDAYKEGYEDVLDKPLKLSDFAINDRCYQRYMSEGKRGAYRGINGNNNAISSENKGFMDPTFLAKVCAGASFVGMLFLIFVAILMETQPLYIRGVSVKPANADDGTYRFRKETSNALKAAAAYFLTMVFSLIYLQAKDMNLELNPAIGRICHLRRLIVSSYFRYRRRHYDAIPDGRFSSTTGPILPMHASSSNGGDDNTMLKSRRRKKRRPRRDAGGDLGGEGGAIEGIVGKIKSWGGIGGYLKRGRKKDR